MRGGRLHRNMAGAKYEGTYILRDYGMFSIMGRYPGIKAMDGEDTLGEVFVVDPDMLRRLDIIEGESYCREKVIVESVDNGEKLQCFAYIYCRPAVGCDRVPENIWHEKRVRVMGYGSLMSSRDLLRMYSEDEKQHISLVGNGIYRGHRLGYTYRAAGREGGVLDVIKGNEDDYVIGVVNEMPYHLMVREIDARESNGKLYERRRIIVESDHGPSSVFCYFLLEHKRDYNGVAPHEKYDNIVLTGMRENDFPEEYIQRYKEYVIRLTEG